MVCIDRAHRVSRTDDTVIVRFTTFRHRTMFYRKRKELKNGVKVHLDLTKARLDLLIKASKYVKTFPMLTSYMLTSIADSKSTFQITMSHFLTQWII